MGKLESGHIRLHKVQLGATLQGDLELIVFQGALGFIVVWERILVGSNLWISMPGQTSSSRAYYAGAMQERIS